MRKGLTTAVVSLAVVAGLTGCGKEASKAPENFVFNTSDGSFSFETVKGADTYIVGVSRILNQETGSILLSINGSSETTLADGSSAYLWSEQTGSVAGLADNDGDGIVEGSVVFRTYSSSATTVGDVIDISSLPLGNYVAQAVPGVTDKLPDPEAASYEFTIGGTLAVPDGFTAAINDAGYMEITAPSDYYLSCLTETGMPEKMEFTISDDAGEVETIVLSDFSYTNVVMGPNKGFTFTNQTVTGSTALDKTGDYRVTVTAVGDEKNIFSASADAYMETTTEAVEFAQKLDLSASASAGAMNLSLSLGTNAAGENVYELTGTINDVAVLRESGSYATEAEVTTEDEKTVYPEGTVITFMTEMSDADSFIMDGVALPVECSESMGWGNQVNVSYGFSGVIRVNGTEATLSAGSGGNGMFPGPGPI